MNGPAHFIKLWSAEKTKSGCHHYKLVTGTDNNEKKKNIDEEIDANSLDFSYIVMLIIRQFT